jgi:thiol-disulfide isomerase/thioredoxin
MKRRLVLATLVITLAIALVAVLGACRSSEASCSTAHQCLPQVAYQDMINNEKFQPEQLKGKVVVVNFWATWCGPCKKEIPAFNRVYAKYKDQGVVMLGVLHDQTVDTNGALNFMSDNEFTYPVVVADQAVLSAYHFPGALPTTFIYDRSGRIVTEHKGPMSEEQLAALVEKTLGRAR